MDRIRADSIPPQATCAPQSHSWTTSLLHCLTAALREPFVLTVYLAAIMGYRSGVPLALLIFYLTSAWAISLPAEVSENKTVLSISIK